MPRIDLNHRLDSNREFGELRNLRQALERIAGAFERLATVAEKVTAPETPPGLTTALDEQAAAAAQLKREVDENKVL